MHLNILRALLKLAFESFLSIGHGEYQMIHNLLMILNNAVFSDKIQIKTSQYNEGVFYILQ